MPSREESRSFWQQHDYKVLAPWVTWDNAAEAMKTTPAMQAVPVQSGITSPLPGATIAVDEDTVDVCGYAWSGGGRAIVRVDLTADGGQTWCSADLEHGSSDSASAAGDSDRNWAWTLWTATVPVPTAAKGKVSSCVPALAWRGWRIYLYFWLL